MVRKWLLAHVRSLRDNCFYRASFAARNRPRKPSTIKDGEKMYPAGGPIAWFGCRRSGKNVRVSVQRKCHSVTLPWYPMSTVFRVNYSCRKKRPLVLPVHLLCLAPLLGGISLVAGYVKLQDDGMVHHPVNRRGGGHGVGEDALPLREDQV